MKKYFLITGLLIISLSACSSEEKEGGTPIIVPKESTEKTGEIKSPLQETIQKSREANEEKEKSAVLNLEIQEEDDTGITIALTLQNPLQKDISAVRALIAYNPEILIGSSIQLAQDAPFQIVAPGENVFDAKKGLVKIGLSASEGKTFTGPESLVATMTFIRKQNTFTSLDLYGFGETQKTVVLQKKDNNTFQDILSPPKVPTLPLFPQS